MATGAREARRESAAIAASRQGTNELMRRMPAIEVERAYRECEDITRREAANFFLDIYIDKWKDYAQDQRTISFKNHIYKLCLTAADAFVLIPPGEHRFAAGHALPVLCVDQTG